jgi:protein associated with RNAse G/E
MRYLGQDDYGIWLGTGPGLRARRGSEPPIVVSHAHVKLLPEGSWWTATFNAEPASTEIYCDVTTPPRWPDPGQVTMADLDLDVLRLRAEQQVLIVDEDEFAEHHVRYGYPADVVSRASHAADWLQAAISAEAEPFASAYRTWLEAATETSW